MKGPDDMNFSPSFTFVNPDTSLGSIVSVEYDTTSNYDLFCVHPTVVIENDTLAHNTEISPLYKIGANLIIKWSFNSLLSLP